MICQHDRPESGPIKGLSEASLSCFFNYAHYRSHTSSEDGSIQTNCLAHDESQTFRQLFQPDLEESLLTVTGMPTALEKFQMD